MERRNTLFILCLISIVVLVQSNPVLANSPSSMDLSYDFTSQELTIDVIHPVADVNTHYIYEVEVSKNSVVVLTRSYTTQNSTSGMSAIYGIAADHGDEFSVIAKCIQSGSITRQVTVVDPENTEPTPTNGTGTPPDMTLLILLAIGIIAVVAVIFTLVRRR